MTNRRVPLSCRTALVALLACATVAGCADAGPADPSSTGATGSTATGSASGSGSASASPSPVTSMAQGSTKSKDGSFALVAPATWKTLKQNAAALAVSAPSPQNQVTQNFIVVIQKQSPTPSLADVIDQSTVAWKQQNSTVTNLPDRTIGGLPSQGFTVERTADGVELTQSQYFVIWNSAVYTLTMTSSTKDAAQASQTLDSILGTWAWTKK